MLLGRSGGEHVCLSASRPLPAASGRRWCGRRATPGPQRGPFAHPSGSTGLCHFPDCDICLGALASWDSSGPEGLLPRPPTPTPLISPQPRNRTPPLLLCCPHLSGPPRGSQGPLSPLHPRDVQPRPWPWPAPPTGPKPGRATRVTRVQQLQSAATLRHKPSVWALDPRQRPEPRPISGPFTGYTSPLLT